MLISGFEFMLIGNIEPERDENDFVRRFMPQDQYDNYSDHPLHRYGRGPFCRFRIAKGLPQLGGVYVLLRNPDTPLYVGQTINLYKRWSGTGFGGISPRNCFKGGQETNCRINNLIFQENTKGKNLSLWFHSMTDRVEKLNSVKSQLISSLRPPWNKALT